MTSLLPILGRLIAGCAAILWCALGLRIVLTPTRTRVEATVDWLVGGLLVGVAAVLGVLAILG